MTASPRVSIVIPAYNEGAAILPVLTRIFEAVTLELEVVVVVDFPEDTTVPVIEKLAESEPRIRVVVSSYGRGPANAIRFGIDAAAAPTVVVTMADGCDDPQQIDQLARLVERGVVVAAASRYARGGQQVVGVGVEVRDPADHGGAGDEVVAAGEQIGEQGDVATVALHEPVAGMLVVGAGHRPVLGVVVDAHHLVAPVQQFLHHVATDEPGGAADQHRAHRFARLWGSIIRTVPSLFGTAPAPW